MLGGKDSVHQVLEKARPGRFQRGELRVHHLRDDGTWWHGENREKSNDMQALLEAAVREPRSPRFDDGNFMYALSAALERGKARQQAMNRFRRLYERKMPWATYSIMALMLVSFGFQALFGGTTFAPTLYRMGANVNSQLGEPFEWWRFLSSVFLHGGLMHIAFNSYVVYALGTFLERIFGIRRYLILVVLSGLLGSVASYYLGGPSQSVGASGAFWGFLGASAALGLKPGVLIPEPMVAHLKKVALFNLFVNLGVSFLPGIDMWAHFGGGLMGFVLVWAGLLQRGLGPIEDTERETPAGKWVSGGFAILLTALMLASVATAWIEGRPWELEDAPEFSYRQINSTEFEVMVPVGWEEESMANESPLVVTMGYGHLLREGAQFILEIRPVGSEALSREQERAILEAVKRQMEENGMKVDLIEEGPYLRQSNSYPHGSIATRLVRVSDHYLQTFFWESFRESNPKLPSIEPLRLFQSVQHTTKR